MKIYDISQEVFSSVVYPGDPSPVKKEEQRIANGNACNLTSFSMCAHNGTHIDAPFHFCEDGDTVEKVPLDKMVGRCVVVRQSGVVSKREAEQILQHLEVWQNEIHKILLKGGATVSPEAAQVFANAHLDLLGVEPQSVSLAQTSVAVHRTLLGAGVILLEGIRLDGVDEGEYLLCAAPLSLRGSDGSPVRAVLIKEERN